MATSTEEARLESLFYEHFSAVRTYTRRRAPEALVDDVVAETFLVAWRKIDHLPDDVRPWLLGVARKTLSTQLRAARRRTSLVEKLKTAERPDAAIPFLSLRFVKEERWRVAGRSAFLSLPVVTCRHPSSPVVVLMVHEDRAVRGERDAQTPHL